MGFQVLSGTRQSEQVLLAYVTQNAVAKMQLGFFQSLSLVAADIDLSVDMSVVRGFRQNNFNLPG